jgi:hypothetical protein
VSFSQIGGAGGVAFSSPSCKLTTAGTCSVSFKAISPGSVSLRATYAGDTENAASFSSQTIVVTGAVGGAPLEQAGMAVNSTISANPGVLVILVTFARAIGATEQTRPLTRRGELLWG